MFIIAGLGNPTLQYEGTRHNAGFDVIDALADKYNISVDYRKNRAFIGKGMIAGRKVILAKPQTYMNLSGESGREAEAVRPRRLRAGAFFQSRAGAHGGRI